MYAVKQSIPSKHVFMRLVVHDQNFTSDLCMHRILYVNIVITWTYFCNKLSNEIEYNTPKYRCFALTMNMRVCARSVIITSGYVY